MKQYRIHYIDLDGINDMVTVEAKSKTQAVKQLDKTALGYTLIYKIEVIL
jgi:hypothetical protein